MSSTTVEVPQRGDIVLIANRRAEYAGKPRPAVVLQSAQFVTRTLTVCLITSIAVDAPMLRIALPVNEETGLIEDSWAAIDQVSTVRRSRVSGGIGHLDGAKMLEISQALLVFLGIADAARR
jgi:mRNA interferase MazF